MKKRYPLSVVAPKLAKLAPEASVALANALEAAEKDNTDESEFISDFASAIRANTNDPDECGE